MNKSAYGMLTVYLICLNAAQICYAEEDNAALANYCVAKGGKVTPMTAWFDTSTGPREGFTDQFCTFERDHGHIAIGLAAFASEHASIAATYMKSLPEIKMGSEDQQDKNQTSNLAKGLGLANPSYAVCKNLGGAVINYKFHGNFRPKEGGDSDICVFGDGSMVSTWSLIYMANHRDGYDEVKGYVKSEPLPM